MRAKLTDEVGVSATTAQIDSALNQRYKVANARSKWRMAEVSLGTTVVDQAEYTLAATVKEIESGEILVGSSEFTSVGTADLWGLKSGRLGLNGDGGVFAVDYNAAGDPWQIELYPAPDTAGLAIKGLVPMLPAALTNGTDSPIFPDDLHEPILVDGAIADLLSRFDERLDMAQWWEDRSNAAVEELRRRANRRGGGGPTQIQVAGYHFNY